MSIILWRKYDINSILRQAGLSFLFVAALGFSVTAKCKMRMTVVDLRVDSVGKDGPLRVSFMQSQRIFMLPAKIRNYKTYEQLLKSSLKDKKPVEIMLRKQDGNEIIRVSK